MCRYSAVFQAGGLVVVVVEIFRRNFLASMVPVIVNTVLNEHQLVIDIVAFVIKGDFHRSRLGEKQRGKILAGWVTRKMRTIAQYSIRDPNGADNQISEVTEPGGAPGRTSTGTFTRTGGPGSMKGSLRGSMRGSMLGMSSQMQNLNLQTVAPDYPGQYQNQTNFGPPAGFSEMAGQTYPESIPELPTPSIRDESDNTPTVAPQEFPNQVNDTGSMNYNPVGNNDVFDYETQHGSNGNHQQYGASGLSTSPLPAILQPGVTDDSTGPPEPHYSNKPFVNTGGEQQYQAGGTGYTVTNDTWPLGSSPQEQQQQQEEPAPGGLRVTNRDSSSVDNEEWAQEAIMLANFAGAGPEEMRRFS
jgi:hypothetical protein